MDSIKLAEELIRFKSISPSSEGSLEYLESRKRCSFSHQA